MVQYQPMPCPAQCGVFLSLAVILVPGELTRPAARRRVICRDIYLDDGPVVSHYAAHHPGLPCPV